MPDTKDTQKKKARGGTRAAAKPTASRTVALAAGLLALVLLGAVLLGILVPDHAADPTRAAFGNLPIAESPLRLNEVMAANASALTLPDGSMPDWIELKNTGRSAVSLEGCVLMANGDPAAMFRFPTLELGAGQTLILYADGGKSAAGELHLPFKISASGETLTLLNAAGAQIDSVTTPKLGRDEVYCRDANGAWQVSAAPTPGGENRVVAPGSPQAAQREIAVQEGGSVVITEVMTRNATYPLGGQGAADYIEVTNVSEAPVDLEGWRLSDDVQNLAKWTFPAATLAAGESLLVHCSGTDRRDGAGNLHANFRLSSAGETLVLTARTGEVTSAVTVPALNTDQAYSLVGSRWTDDLPPTPGAANTQANARAIGDELLRANPAGLRISEISAAASGTAPDWIELYNAGQETIDLSAYALSDNPRNPAKWRFSQGTLAPGQYTAVFCSGGEPQKGGWQYTSFRLAAAGGYSVVLSRADGTVIDRAYVPTQYEDLTYGRVEGRDGFYFFPTGTPLAKNEGLAYQGKAAAPEYSQPGGMYAAGDVLSVTLTAQPGARIYYTLDCTDPTEASTPYTGPIAISGTTILRTRVYQEGYLESFVDTQSYLYDVNNSGVFVVSLVSDPANLTSPETGIMVKGSGASDTYPYKGANFWMDWEREAHVEIFAGDGSPVLDSGCGIKLHGQYSRAEKQQAFKVIARTKYGDNRFHAALFSNRPYTEYQSFLLRSSGQDTNRTRMRDSVLSALAADTSVMYQETEICVLYLDGKYWGQYNLRERINTASICQFEGWEGQEDDIDLVKANRNIMQGSNETFAKLLDYVKKADPTTDEFYENLGKVVDIENYIEYMALEIFVGNGDTLNVKRYRNVNADGRWRWVLFDLDWAFFVDTNSINRWLTPGGMGTKLFTDNSLFIACMKNPRFRDEFLTHMGRQMATTFSTEHVLSLIEARTEVLAPLLPDQFARWGETQKSYNSDMSKLLNYAKNRPTKLLKYFSTCKYLDLSTEDMYHYFGDALEVIQSYAGN